MEKITQSSPVGISVSVVSHGQMELIEDLMGDLQSHCGGVSIELILTLNTSEAFNLDQNNFSYPIRVIKNTAPKGFAANHNQAFKLAHGGYFCIVNPDIRLDKNPFPALVACLEDATVGVVAPLVVGPNGDLEDSARRFPTPRKILLKALGKGKMPDYTVVSSTVYPDWVGGMFMLFSRAVFEHCGGFDERYFLYYEDVDLCGRLNLSGCRAALCPNSTVVHHAQRSSHRSWRYMRWHLASMLRFFLSPVYRQLKRRHRL
jgi:GT2 family glycosyltransferase